MSDDVLIGRQLANYKIERIIGRGGMAQVYYGYDVRLQRPVAIKVLDARYRDNSAYANRFVREAQMVATWRHENILQVYYADEQDGFYFFVMEYVDGSDLGKLMSDYASRGQFLPHSQVIRIGRAIAAALDYAHDKKVIHRDVKPSNVMIAVDERVTLADFGLALDVQQGTLGEAFGTAHYIAPEQARNSSNAVPQSDLYSLGVILYELLTGSVPFDDPSPISVSLQHVTQPPPPPRQVNPALNAGTEAVLLKALSKSPQDRYQTGLELMDALEQVLDSDPSASAAKLSVLSADPAVASVGSSVSSVSSPERASRADRPIWRKMWPTWWLVAGGGLVCLTAMVIAVVVVVLGRSYEQPPEQMPWQVALGTPTGVDEPRHQIELPLLARGDFSLSPLSPPSTLSPLATPTYQAPARDRMVIYYNPAGLYVFNDSKQDHRIEMLILERLDARGTVVERFEGRRWSQYYAIIQSQGCVRIEIRGENIQRPSECRFYNSLITAARDDAFVIWTPKADSRQFRVLWDEVVVGLCEMAAGKCQVFLP